MVLNGVQILLSSRLKCPSKEWILSAGNANDMLCYFFHINDHFVLCLCCRNLKSCSLSQSSHHPVLHLSIVAIVPSDVEIFFCCGRGCAPWLGFSQRKCEQARFLEEVAGSSEPQKLASSDCQPANLADPPPSPWFHQNKLSARHLALPLSMFPPSSPRAAHALQNQKKLYWKGRGDVSLPSMRLSIYRACPGDLQGSCI